MQGISWSTMRFAKTIHSPNKDVWTIFVGDELLRYVSHYTEEHGIELPRIDLEKFIGLQYACGYYGKPHFVELLWSDSLRVDIFRRTMSRSRISVITSALCFEDRDFTRNRVSAQCNYCNHYYCGPCCEQPTRNMRVALCDMCELAAWTT